MFKFFRKKEEAPKNFEEILSHFQNLEKGFANISKELEEIKLQNKSSIQKIGVVRFNPFKEVGGNQSFSIALLDANDDGVVITSLYTREGNRMYAKPIKDRKSEYSLSKEEAETIEKAINSKMINPNE